MIAAISITGPNKRIDVPKITEGVVKAAKQVSSRLGYAISYNNFSSGITSISAPVKNKHKEIIAAVELIGYEQRLTQVSIQKYIKLVMMQQLKWKPCWLNPGDRKKRWLSS